MPGTIRSLIVRCWLDKASGAMRVQIVEVDSAAELRLANNSFVLRISADPSGQQVRCSIRHTQSGRETYVQGGPGLREFVRECLLADETREPETREP